MGSESGWNLQQYLESFEYPANREGLISAARSRNAPRDFIRELEGLDESAGQYKGKPEFSSPNEVLEVLGYEKQEEQEARG